MNANTENCLRIGDIITLKYSRYTAYLSAEGILVEDVGVSPSTKSFEDSLFEVCIQLQYSAANGFDEFVEKFPGDLASIRDKETKKHFNALIRGKQNEILMNESFMKQKVGSVVKFGETVQLKHVKSGKYLTVKKNELARDERENIGVSLVLDGSVDSWIQILPRFKINKEGDLILNNTEVVLKMLERSGEYLHCAERNPPKRKSREVNSSTDAATPWRVSIYQSSRDSIFRLAEHLSAKEAKERDGLFAGELVYIRDPETNSIMMPFFLEESIGGTGRDDASGSVHNRIKDLDESQASDEEEAEADDEDDDVSMNSAEEYISEHGELVLKPMDEDKLDSNALWMIETKVIVRGGPIYWKTDQIRFRHLNSGMYLSRSNGNRDTDKFIMVDKIHDKRTLFNITELSRGKFDQLTNSKPVQIKQGIYFLERGEYFDRQTVHECVANRNRQKAVSLIMNRFVPVSEEENTKASKKDAAAASASNGPALDVFVGSAAKRILRMYLDLTEVNLHGKVHQVSIWPQADPTERVLFTVVIEKMLMFVKGYPIFYNAGTMVGFMPSRSVVFRRQNMLREQGMLAILMKMLDALTPIANLAMNRAHFGSQMMEDNRLYHMGKSVIGECLKLLLELIRGNPTNQAFIAKYMLIILGHVSVDPVAATVTREMLSSSRELQETMIHHREISIFAEQLRESSMNPLYLQLMQACCSSQVGQTSSIKSYFVHSYSYFRLIKFCFRFFPDPLIHKYAESLTFDLVLIKNFLA